MKTKANLNSGLITLVFLLMMCSALATGGTIYVDAGASGSGTGTSWADAYNYLQDALAAASSGDEIRVAASTYRPDQGDAVTSGDRDATFQLINGVAIYGGFPSGGGAWEDRDPNAHETILSGDTGIPDATGDNSYHVVTGSDTDETALLGGFTVTGGRADGPWENNRDKGAGMYSNNGCPTLTNCNFSNNFAHEDGGGLFNRYSSSPTLTNCSFSGNSAGDDGGAIYNYDSNPNVVNCSFSGNWAGNDGGGMYNANNSPTLTNCNFSNNFAHDDGGGLCNQYSSSPTLTNCNFSNNSADDEGGGMYNHSSSPTVTNCNFSGNIADNKGGGIFNVHSSTLTATGCTFTGNVAEDDGGGIYNHKSSSTLTNCNFSNNLAGGEGGGIFTDPNSSLTVTSCTFSYNGPDAVWVEGSYVQVLGVVTVVSNNLAGDGTIEIDPDATLDLDNSIVLCNLSGTGTVQVDVDTGLVIGGDATVDLGDPNDPNAKGELRCAGLLTMKDNAQITNASVNITRASFEDNASILSSVITVDSNAPYGQFFIEPNVTIMDNVIYADGDRYMDLDPCVFAGVMQNNRIFVTITEGVGQAQGGLFELRGDPAFADPYPSCYHDTFLCRVNPYRLPDCNVHTWTIERLELVKGAKLNLTNRFPFQPPYDPGSDDDVLYVKELILRENSVLNTSFNWVYFAFMKREQGAVIKDVPLLGFSLINIALDDATEFIVRVTHNNFEHLEDPNYNRMHVTRIVGEEPDPNGVMEMRNIADLDPNSSTCGQVVNAQAKGMFAKAGEGEILIKFEYMFIEDPCDEAELVVYLSDNAKVGENLVEVARVRPPAQGTAGSIGSGSFTTFSGIFPRGNLNFIRGTYVELELRGTGARCRIDDWDPGVACTAVCGNYYIDPLFPTGVDVYDYLVLLAEFGLISPGSVGKGCLDIVTDGVINTDDLMAWDIVRRLHLCPSGEGASASGAFAPDEAATGGVLPSIQTFETQSVAESALLIFGKAATGAGVEIPNSYLYSVDVDGTCVGDAIEPVCPSPPCEQNEGRFVTDSRGNVYHVSGNFGLVRQDTAEVVVAPTQNISYESSKVSVGLNSGNGLMLSDAEFHPCDPNIVYIVPVHVEPPEGQGCPYQAAAKLQLTETGYNVLKLYGMNPATDPNQCNTKSICNEPDDFVYNPDVQHLREIEISPDGNNLFVLSAHWVNLNNWILIYDEAAANSPEVRVWLCDPNDNAPNVIAPTAMVVSSLDEKLYLASSVSGPNDEPNDLATGVYHFSINKTDHKATGLSYEGHLGVSCPEPNICGIGLCDANFGFTSAITSMTENPDDGTLYVTGFTAPKFPALEELPYGEINGVFTTPMLAVIAPDTNETVEAIEITGCDPSYPLVLPFSIVWAAEIFGGADITGDDGVGAEDFAILALHWLESNCAASSDCSGADVNKSDAVDWADLAVLAQYWLETRCAD